MIFPIYSGGVINTDIYLLGAHSGKNLLLTCSQGDTCNIYCSTDACSTAMTHAICYGKCFISCPTNILSGAESECISIDIHYHQQQHHQLLLQ